jgi:aerotaxis receptor
MRNNQSVTQNEYVLKDGAAIISRTDKKGQITDCNEEFVEASGFERDELLGQPHNMVRHPDMPPEAFRDMWSTLKSGRPWSGFVKNRRKNGDHYWVKATATPLPDHSGYFSVRTKASREDIAAAEALYAKMRADASVKLHEGRVVSKRRLPALRVSARLWLMLGISLLTLIVVGADSVYNLAVSNQAVSNLYKEKLQPLDHLAKTHDLVQTAITETLLALDDGPNPEQLARHKKVIQESRDGIDVAWQAFLKKSMTPEEKGLVETNAAQRSALLEQIQNVISRIDAGQIDEARRIARTDLMKFDDQEGASIDQLKSYQVKASEGFYETSQKQFHTNLWHAILAFVIGGGLSLLIGVFTRHHILSRLHDARQATRAVAAGNLIHDLPEISKDELGELLVDFAIMRNSLHELVASLRQNSIALNQASTELAAEAGRSTETAAQQANSATGMAAAVEQLSVSIDMVDDRASQANAATQEANSSSREGGVVIHEATSKMQHISEAINSAAGNIGELERLSGNISNIVNVIRDVADQTNLLALNAAIEAARAGEQGRGFAVVADEVRKLAERTGKATGEIASVIEEIQFSTKRAVDAMGGSVTQANEGVALSQQAGGSIQEIQSGSTRVLQAVSDISHALKEQVVAAHEITARLEDVSEHADSASSAASNLAQSAANLKFLAQQAEEFTGKFRIS